MYESQNWYKQLLERNSANIQNSVRFFRVPGMNHVSGVLLLTSLMDLLHWSDGWNMVKNLIVSLPLHEALAIRVEKLIPRFRQTGHQTYPPTLPIPINCTL